MPRSILRSSAIKREVVKSTSERKLNLATTRKLTKIRIVESCQQEYNELIIKPENVFRDHDTGYRYRHLDNDGLVQVGSIIKRGECLASRVRIYNVTRPENSNNYPDVENTSIFASYGMEGCVIDVQTRESNEDPSVVNRITILTVEEIGYVLEKIA